jgi:hypothetical protein
VKISHKDIFKNGNKCSAFLEPVSLCRGHVKVQPGCVNVFLVPPFYGQLQFRINSHKAMTYVRLTFLCRVAENVLHIFE